MKNKYIIYGASGHGKVIADILEKCGMEIMGFIDDDPLKIQKFIFNYKILGGIGKINTLNDSHICIIIGIGDNQIRQSLSEKVSKIGGKFGKAIHPSCQIGRDVKIGEGTVLLANTAVNSDTIIGTHCIINTSASVDHDCEIGNFVHIAPGSHLGGGIKIGNSTFIGLGSSIKNNIIIGENSIIGAGSVVINDIESNSVYVGNPAKKLRDN